MKKMIFAALAASCLFACTPKTETASTQSTPPEADGYTLASSANIDLAYKSAKCIESGDTATYRSTYSTDAVIHENGVDETVDQNMAAIQGLKSAGVTMKIDSGALYHEIVYKEPKGNHTNYVTAYMLMTLTKGPKQIKLYMHAVDAIKDGKQVEEWLFYDTKAVAELLK